MSSRASLAVLGAIAFLACLRAPPLRAGEAADEPRCPVFRNPAISGLWKTVKTVEFSDKEMRQFCAGTNVMPYSACTWLVDAGCAEITVTVALFPDSEPAQKFAARSPRLKKPGLLFFLKGNLVFTLASADRQAALAARHALGPPGRDDRECCVEMKMVPVMPRPGELGQYGRLGALFRALQARKTAPGGPSVRAEIRRLSEPLLFGSSLEGFRTEGEGAGVPSFSFDPTPNITATAAGPGGKATYWFRGLEEMRGVPFVWVREKVTVRPFSTWDWKNMDEKRREECFKWFTRKTALWPLDAPGVRQLAGDLPAGLPPLKRLSAVLDLSRGALKPGGDPEGRSGVPAALGSRAGSAWDRADLFVTLCRACGIPCWQVLGWVEGEGIRVWAEAYAEGTGWVMVDPTRTWLGVSAEYLPILTSDDGRLALLLAAEPEARRGD